MNPELTSLVWISTFTGLLWIPYVLNRTIVVGINGTVGYPADAAPLSPWAQRLRAAHSNAVENLVVFAALIVAARLVGLSNAVTVAASGLYLWSRILHAITYTFGIPWVRTLAFVGGFAAQTMIAWQLLVG